MDVLTNSTNTTVPEENPNLETETQYFCFSGNTEQGELKMVLEEKKISNMYSLSGKSNQSFLNVVNRGFLDKIVSMLTEAVNNRTRQRNYFRLYNELLENQITEEEFEKEISENEDDYVLEGSRIPDREDAVLALDLARKIKEVGSTEDLALLFSFDVDALEKLAEKNEKDG